MANSAAALVSIVAMGLFVYSGNGWLLFLAAAAISYLAG